MLDPVVSEEGFQQLHQKFARHVPLTELLRAVAEKRERILTANERVIAAISVSGTEANKSLFGFEVPSYGLLRDCVHDGAHRLFGLDMALHKLIAGLGQPRRAIVAFGPSGTGKSSLIRAVKERLESYSEQQECAYEVGFVTKPQAASNGDGQESIEWSGTAENPLAAIPRRYRPFYRKRFGLGAADSLAVRRWLSDEDLGTPDLRTFFHQALRESGFDPTKALERFVVRPISFSDADSRGFATISPAAVNPLAGSGSKLTDFLLRMVRKAQGGILEVNEVGDLHSDVLAALHDLISEGVIEDGQGRKYTADVCIMCSTSREKYEKLLKSEGMSTRIIGVPFSYLVQVADEKSLYARDLKEAGNEKSLAPFTIDVMAMLSVLGRLDAPQKKGLTKFQKMQLYNGETLPGVSNDDVRAEFLASQSDGLKGQPPKTMQNLAAALLADYAPAGGIVGPIELFEVIQKAQRLKGGKDFPYSADDVGAVQQWYRDEVRRQVGFAWEGSSAGFKDLFLKYVAHVRAYVLGEKIRDRFTGRDMSPDERLMRSVEEAGDIAESKKDEFRQSLLNGIGSLGMRGVSFENLGKEEGDKTFDQIRAALPAVSKAVTRKLTADIREVSSGRPGHQAPPNDVESFLRLVREHKGELHGVGEEVFKMHNRLIKKMMQLYGYDELYARRVLSFVASFADGKR